MKKNSIDFNLRIYDLNSSLFEPIYNDYTKEQLEKGFYKAIADLQSNGTMNLLFDYLNILEALYLSNANDFSDLDLEFIFGFEKVNGYSEVYYEFARILINIVLLNENIVDCEKITNEVFPNESNTQGKLDLNARLILLRDYIKTNITILINGVNLYWNKFWVDYCIEHIQAI